MVSPAASAHEFAGSVRVGPVEEMLWRIDDASAGAFRVGVLMRLDGEVDGEAMALAVRRVQQRHPKLRAAVVRGSDGYRRYHVYEVPPQIPFEILDYDDQLPWREETARLMDLNLPPVGPLAAVRVFRSRARNCCELLLTVHHGIADGRSAIMLLEDILTEYARAKGFFSVSSLPELPLVATAQPTPSINVLSRLWLVRWFLRTQRMERTGRHTALPEARDVRPHSQWVHWVFSREETLRLVQRCRREQVSLGAAMFAAACCGLVERLPGSHAVFKCQFPFDVRYALDGPAGPVTAQDLGCFISAVNQFVEVRRQPAIWDVARRIHGHLEAFVEKQGPAFVYKVAGAAANQSFASAWKALAVAQLRRPTILATNYGVLQMREMYADLRPRECTVTVKNYAMGPSLLMEALVLGQRLNIGFAADQLDPTFWDGLHASVRSHLDAMAGVDKAARLPE